MKFDSLPIFIYYYPYKRLEKKTQYSTYLAQNLIAVWQRGIVVSTKAFTPRAY